MHRFGIPSRWRTWRIPVVITVLPGHVTGEGRYQVEQGPAHDEVVVDTQQHAHDELGDTQA